jgi:hypothetical protein
MVYSYSAQDVSIIIGGMTVEGIEDGSFVSITASQPVFKTKRTASGTISRTLIKNQQYNMKVRLTQTSEFNDKLWLLLTTDKSVGDAIFPIFVKDFSSGTSLIAGQAWICDFPEITYSNGMEIREWSIDFTSEALAISGGTDGESSLQTALKLFTSGII